MGGTVTVASRPGATASRSSSRPRAPPVRVAEALPRLIPFHVETPG